MSKYIPVDRGRVSGGGQLLRHIDDPRRWMARVFIGRSATGRKRYVSKVVHGGKRDADKVLTDLLQQKYQGRITPRSSATLADLVSEWLAHKERDVSYGTLVRIKGYFRRYVLPVLGHKKLTSITLRDIDDLYGRMLAGTLPEPECSEQGWSGKPLSANTIRLTHAALSQTLSQAVKWGMLPFSPAAEASLPPVRAKEKRALTSDERARLVRACEGEFYGIFYRVLVDTGLRPGEACGLQWTDVDFENGRLAVQRAVTIGPEGPVLKPPKTPKSRRTVPMLDGLRDALLAHLAWQRERGLDAAGFVVTTQDGRMVAPFRFGKASFRRTLAAAGIAGSVSLYDLRHTFGSLHVRAGTPLKVVSEVMGHASIQQTANIYQHLSVDVTEEWMRRYEDALTSYDQASVQLN